MIEPFTGNVWPFEPFPYMPEQRHWLDTLKADPPVYKQGTDFLAKFSFKSWHYCCLGVGCDLAGDREIEQTEFDDGETTDDGGMVITIEFDGERQSAPRRLVERLGLRGDNGQHRAYFEPGWSMNSGPYMLTYMNDRGDTFAQIAAAIEADPTGYFTNLDVFEEED